MHLRSGILCPKIYGHANQLTPSSKKLRHICLVWHTGRWLLKWVICNRLKCIFAVFLCFLCMLCILLYSALETFVLGRYENKDYYYYYYYYIEFSIISQLWDITGHWIPSSWKTRTCLSWRTNAMAVDDLAAQGARLSAAMVLTFSWNIPVLALERLTKMQLFHWLDG